jgi:hypothetical protein
MTNKLRQEIEKQISQYEISEDGPDDRDQLVRSIWALVEPAINATEDLARQLHKMLGDECALTIPLSDGTVAKVKFSQPPTLPTLSAFAKIFQSIVDNYAVTDEGGKIKEDRG